MMRYLAVLMLFVCLMFLAGCSIPTGNDAQETENTTYIAAATEPTVSAETGGAVATEPDSGVKGIQTVNNENQPMMPVTIYYQDSDGYIIPMTRWVDKQPGIARAALSGLTDSALTREELQYYGVYPVLPVNTEILGINIKDGIAAVDFNNKLLDYGNGNIERNIVTAVVYTLTEFPTISSVKLLVNGNELKTMKYGTDASGLLSRTNTPINSPLAKGAAKADIYRFKRANEGFTYLLPVSVEKDEKEEVTPELLIRGLLQPETDEKLLSELPEGAELNKCSVNSGTLTMDFSGKFLAYGGNAREEGILKQLVYTAGQIGGISKVKITVNGEDAELPEGTYISSGIAIPKTINDIIDR